MSEGRKVSLKNAIVAIMELIDYHPNAVSIARMLKISSWIVDDEMTRLVDDGVVVIAPRRKLDAPTRWALKKEE